MEKGQEAGDTQHHPVSPAQVGKRGETPPLWVNPSAEDAMLCSDCSWPPRPVSPGSLAWAATVLSIWLRGGWAPPAVNLLGSS